MADERLLHPAEAGERHAMKQMGTPVLGVGGKQAPGKADTIAKPAGLAFQLRKRVKRIRIARIRSQNLRVPLRSFSQGTLPPQYNRFLQQRDDRVIQSSFLGSAEVSVRENRGRQHLNHC